MALSGDRLCRETVSAALEFARRKPWTNFDDTDAFFVTLPSEAHPAIATILGSAGEEFGFALFLGENAYSDHQRLIDGEESADNLGKESRQLALTLTPLGEIPLERRRFLDRAGFSGRRDIQAPFFVSKTPGRLAGEINQTEAMTLLFAIRGVLGALDRGLLTRDAISRDDALLSLAISGDPRAPEVASTFVPRPADPEPVVGGDSPTYDWSGLPKKSGRWLVGFPVLPVAAPGDLVVKGLVVADESTEQALDVSPTMGCDVASATRIFHDLVTGKRRSVDAGLPEEIAFSSRELYDAMSSALMAAGVRCSFEATLPLLDALVADLRAWFEESSGTAVEGGAEGPTDDLMEWKFAGRALVRRMLVAAQRDGSLHSGRSYMRYFGSEEDGEDFLEGDLGEGAEQAYKEWLFADYRQSSQAKTIVERLLLGRTSLEERALLEARQNAVPSLFRIDGVLPGESLSLVDLVSGERVVAHDVAMSRTSRIELCIPARVFAAGDFHFVAKLGPALLATETDEAIEYLETLGMSMTHSSIARRVHLFGRLWTWREERRRRPLPRLCNTDGDPLEPQTARFGVTDAAAVKSALGGRADVDFDDDEKCWTWFREGPPRGTALGDRTLLGRIEFCGDELRLEVNSSARLERARTWLEAIAGVRFIGRFTHPIDLDAMRSGPRREPDEITPEFAAAANATMREHYLHWIDEPIPALDGRTPREVCRTPEGRDRVAVMIRTMPSPVGSLGDHVEVPRDEMLRALGIE
ncbi:MAG: DUF2384 domain-containing protein [Planctomycetes bacterium]|nr:DUF2384 domain-containing protein [Planctomycetota bacterium]